jgi:hypothetical protein
MSSDPVRYTNHQTSPATTKNTLALVPTAAALEALAQPSLPDQEAYSLSTTCGATPAMKGEFTRRGGGEASRENSLLSFANFIEPPARCRRAQDSTTVPNA